MQCLQTKCNNCNVCQPCSTSQADRQLQCFHQGLTKHNSNSESSASGSLTSAAAAIKQLDASTIAGHIRLPRVGFDQVLQSQASALLMPVRCRVLKVSNSGVRGRTFIRTMQHQQKLKVLGCAKSRTRVTEDLTRLVHGEQPLSGIATGKF